VPDHLVAQIIHGQLITLPRPAPRHARASSIMGGKLVPSYDEGIGGPGGWWILFEPELHLRPHILVPDLAGWRRERMPSLPETAFFELSPDWVCEVLSPSTQRMDRADKLPIYASFGVGHVWLVDPEAKTLEIFSLNAGHWQLERVWQGEDTVCAPPFEALSFNLGSMWG
jgi:Uma2 family endonuclease